MTTANEVLGGDEDGLGQQDLCSCCSCLQLHSHGGCARSQHLPWEALARSSQQESALRRRDADGGERSLLCLPIWRPRAGDGAGVGVLAAQVLL